ncbi:TPA: hypothetical protein ACRCCW_001998 [Escherichia coli]|nr:hypothetical protein [Escherichia albertii]
MKQMSLIEMDGFLKGKCIPRDLKVNETNAEYLVRKFAEAEAKCAAMAAENAGLKSGAMDEIKVINRGGQAYCVKDGVQVNPMYARGWNDYRAKSLQSDTPATDAFLAEVRASELDSLAGLAETMLVKFSNQQCSSDMHEVVGWKMVLQQANNRASRLRKGGNQ